MKQYLRTSVVSALIGAVLTIASGPTLVTAAGYKLSENWAKLPSGVEWGPVAGVATDGGGNVYAFRRAEPPILEVDGRGGFLRAFGAKMFAKPHGIRFDDQGSLWITDQGPNNVVSKLDRQGTVLLTLGKMGVGGDGPDTFNGPTDVIVAPNGLIFVADGEFNNRVVKFSRDGRFIKQWGTKGNGPGQFLVPHALAMDSRGRIFVADRDNNRVQLFDQEGTFLTEWTQFGAPSGIFITKDDRLYVLATSGKKGIFVASASDGVISEFIETTQTGLHLVAVDARGNVYAAGLGTSGLVKFATN